MIWEYALPEGRVWEVLDSPNAKQKTPAHEGLMFANVHHEPPPALASVCRESRHFVLRRYKPLKLSNITKYVDLERDLLLLEPYLLVKRLLRTLHFLSQIPLVRDNVSRLALGTSYGMQQGICHNLLSWKVSKNNMSKLLARLAKLPKLKKLLFVVHQEFQFEFDFRYPYGSTSGLLHAASGKLPSYGDVSSWETLGGTSSIPANLHSATGLPSPPLSQSPTPPPPSFSLPPPATTPSISSAPSPSLSGAAAFAQQHRPQLVHQAYRFKFDIETNINHHHPRHPHNNEFLYYPLEIDEEKEDYLDSLRDEMQEEGEWCDPWPTNDDWRRFRRRFTRTLLQTFQAEKGPVGVTKPECLPTLEGASLLWRYTR
jgi:hypothetical protein